MSEQQHTFYCQELGTLLMCLIHVFKSGRCRVWVPRRGSAPSAGAVLPGQPRCSVWSVHCGGHKSEPEGRPVLKILEAEMFLLPLYIWLRIKKDSEPQREVTRCHSCIRA